MEGAGLLLLCSTSDLVELPSSISFFGSTCRASCLFYKGIWKGGVVTAENLLLHQTGTSYPLSHYISPCRERVRSPLYDVPCLLSGPASGKGGCGSTGLCLSHTPCYSTYSPPSALSLHKGVYTKEFLHLGTPPRAVLATAFQYECMSRAHSASWHLGGSIPPGLGLGSCITYSECQPYGSHGFLQNGYQSPWLSWQSFLTFLSLTSTWTAIQTALSQSVCPLWLQH